jgi:hypothetical protein
VFCSFLALVLIKALDDRIAALGCSGSWPEIIADVHSLTETEIEHDGNASWLVPPAPLRKPRAARHRLRAFADPPARRGQLTRRRQLTRRSEKPGREGMRSVFLRLQTRLSFRAKNASA